MGASGPWLAQTLEQIRNPAGGPHIVPREFKGTLRPYQETFRWLHLLSSMRLGACLADDMGLGKTIQVLALLLADRDHGTARRNLLVAPASLIANWIDEIERFAPALRVLVAHPSFVRASELQKLDTEQLEGVDLVI